MNKHDRYSYIFLSIASFIVFASFGIWWFQSSNLPTNWSGAFGRVADIVLFAIVSYIIWYPIVMQGFAWALALKIRSRCSPPLPQPNLRIAFLTTYVPGSEPIELLYRCLPAIINVDYPHDTWLLDEGNVPEVKELCSKMGVKHFSRYGISEFNCVTGKFAAKTKGGNHNAWYDQHGASYDIIAQMDTDFVPKRDYLTKTLGYFSDPQVGLVGTPQIYGNTNSSVIALGAAQQAYNFYGPILRGFSGIHTTLMIGANHIVRAAAMQDIGHYSAHITEDVITGMKLHSRKWKSIYVPEVLAVGEGPATWNSYFIQQQRWAYGSMDVFLRLSAKLLCKMRFRQAVSYFFLLQHYFSGLLMTLGLLALGLYAAFGISSASVSLKSFIEFYVPVIVMCEVMSLYLQRFNIRPLQERGVLLFGRILSIASWPFFFLALLTLITRRKLTYRVTPKGTAAVAKNSETLDHFVVHFCIAIYCITCIVLSFILNHVSAVIIFWLSISALTMLLVPFTIPIAKLIGAGVDCQTVTNDINPDTESSNIFDKSQQPVGAGK